MVGPFRKKYVVLFFIYALCSNVTFAGNDEELFLRGNKYYEQKDYDKALQSYEAMTKKGRSVFYNMGNVSFYKGDYAQALVYWSRAQVGATPEEYNRIESNKDHTLALLGKESESSVRYKIVKILHDVLPYVSLFLLQLFFLVCWYAFLFSARNKQMKIRKTILSCLCLFMVISGGVLSVHYMNHTTRTGVVVKKEAHLFAAPHKGFQALCPVTYAHNVTVKEMREGWYKIRYADMIGWVEGDVIQII